MARTAPRRSRIASRFQDDPPALPGLRRPAALSLRQPTHGRDLARPASAASADPALRQPGLRAPSQPYRPEAEGRSRCRSTSSGSTSSPWSAPPVRRAPHASPRSTRTCRPRGGHLRAHGHQPARPLRRAAGAWRSPTTGRLQGLLAEQGRVILAIDGLQPDVGHEVLWVIRDCLAGEVLLARSLLSARQRGPGRAAAPRSRDALGVPIAGVVSDGQHSIRKAVAQALPGVPHQLCQFHYLREAARPIYEADRHAKKELKKQVRGVRPIERRWRAATTRRPRRSAATARRCAAP